MPITVFNDVFLPNSVISAGVRGKNMRQNTRTRTQGGFEQVNVNWTRTLRQYEIGIAPMRVDAWQAIEAIQEITDGGAFGFLIEDPKDNTVTGGLVGPAYDGSPYQLYKRVTESRSGRYVDRAITRPQALGFQLYKGGILQAPSSYTLDADKGRLTISGNPDPATLTWEGKFYVPVHFMNDEIDWEMLLGGQMKNRIVAGPSVILEEVRE